MRDIITQPGYSADDFKALLASREFVFADLFTFYTKFGDVLRYSSSQKDVFIFPLDNPSSPLRVAYDSRKLLVEGLQLKIGTGIEVDEQEASINWAPRMKYMGLPMQDAFRLGRFDGTVVRRDRVYATDWGYPWIGGVQMFQGKLASVDKIDRSSASVKVKSDLMLLDVQMPRNLYQPSCVHTLFDPGCTLNRSAFEQMGIAETGSTSGMIIWSGATPQLTLGRLDAEDGTGVLQMRTIRKVDGNKIYLAYPLDSVPNAGMVFRVYPGCKRTLERCKEFNNEAHFKGFPFVPIAEAAM